MQDSDEKKSILCIDDDQAMHALLKAQLEISGYRSLHTISGAEAFKTLQDNRVDLVVLDINMPDMDGFQILRQLKIHNETRHIPVIFLSSLGREHLKVKGLESGADDFIVKPFTGPELIARIKAVLRRHGPRDQPVGDVRGKLEDLGLFELLHMLSFSGKAAVISFRDMDGEIIVADGAILSARQSSWQGREALLRLFLTEKGTFSILYEKRGGESVGSIESLLLFISNELDEIRDKIKTLVPEDAALYYQGGLDVPQKLDVAEDAFPLSLPDLLSLMPGKLRQNISIIEKALEQKVLITRKN